MKNTEAAYSFEKVFPGLLNLSIFLQRRGMKLISIYEFHCIGTTLIILEYNWVMNMLANSAESMYLFTLTSTMLMSGIYGIIRQTNIGKDAIFYCRQGKLTNSTYQVWMNMQFYYVFVEIR